jgi:chemotaxis protein CheD
MKRKINIHIGQYHASTYPTVVQTLVGSCVAVCLFDPVTRIGGMNHILLPGRADMKQFDAPARYGINAMELLINRIMNLGGKRHSLVAKAFGGAHLLPAITEENGVGKKIAAFVMEFLRNESIRVINYDLEGHDSRRIYFHTDTGEVFLKRIPSRYYSAITAKERKMLNYVRKQAEKPAEVILYSQASKEEGQIRIPKLPEIRLNSCFKCPTEITPNSPAGDGKPRYLIFNSHSKGSAKFDFTRKSSPALAQDEKFQVSKISEIRYVPPQTEIWKQGKKPLPSEIQELPYDLLKETRRLLKSVMRDA